MKPSRRTLHDYLYTLAHSVPDKQLIGSDGSWLTCRQFLASVEATAADYVHLGLRSGDYVGLRCYRTIDTIISIFALQAIGAVAVLTDPRQSTDDFLSGCDIPISVTAVIDRYLYTDKRTGRQSFLISSTAAGHAFPVKHIDSRLPGFIIFTSGSTGKRKAVMLSQYNLVNNLINSQPLGCYTEDDIALGALPLDHVFGLVLIAGIAVLGYGVYLPDQTAVPALLKAIEAEKITRMNGVPSLYLAMAEQAEQYDLHSLRAGFIGGGPFTVEQFCRIEEKLEMTLIPVYGMSECIGIACTHWNDPREVRAEGSAPFYSMNTGKILLEDGTEAAPGEIGEVWVTGPARMVGYWPDAMPEEELLPTGDLGYLDEAGRLHLTGRKKDIIIRNGNNLSARHIEEALLSIPGVKEVCVVGLPHELQGEVPCTLVVGERTPMELFAILPKLLPKNQIPMEIHVTDAIPLTPSGKPDKQKIREVLMRWKV